jgi:glycosyltransferase involved in cell wall biosynthesis
VRICIVTVASYAHGIGGMQSHALDLARGLVKAGHEVEVIAPRHPERLRETEFVGARWHFLDVSSRRPNLPMRHPDWIRGSAVEFERLHDARPFDIVHSESTSALGLLRRNVHRRVPFAVKFHGNYAGLVQAAVGRAVRAETLSARVWEAKHVVWISGQHFVPLDTVFRFRSCEAMVPSRQQLGGTRRSYLLDEKRMHVVPNGIDAELFRPRPRAEARSELGLDDAGPLLVSVGRLDREKGFQHAIRALVRLNEARLVLVGTGVDRASFEQLAREVGVAERVVFAGKQEPAERVATYLSAADVFLFPTERDEAAPMVLPEAMACGLPVVASSIGGVTEVIDRPGENGFLLPPGDLDRLAEVVAQLVADPVLRERVGTAARARILAEYTLERMIERTLGVYEIAAGRLGASAGTDVTSPAEAA